MSLTLDPTLSNAQDNLVRQPIIELISTQATAAIPFNGEYFNTSDIPENRPGMISHSSGRVVSICIRNNNEIIVLSTDVDKMLWVEFNIYSAGLYEIVSAALCELTNGNIGIVFIEKHSTTYYLKYMVINIDSDSTASQVIVSTIIGTYLSPFVIDSLYVCQLQDDSFILVYSYYDGTDYLIYKRTSTDFYSWSAALSIALSGFTTTHNTNNPSLIQVESGDIILFLDHVTNKAGDSIVTNIFKLISDDNGVTWDVPDQLTSFTVWGSGGIRPYPALTSGNIIKLSFHETNSVLFMNYDSDLWQSDCANPSYGAGSSIHYDSVAKRLYVKQLRVGAGIKNLCGITVIDTENWVVERNYNTGTVPDYSDLFFDVHVWYGAEKHHSEGKYVAISTRSASNMATMVINGNSETITTYVFKSDGTYDDIVQNMDEWPNSDCTEMWENGSQIFGTWVDEDSDRVYVGMGFNYLYQPYIQIGYIDLTEVKDPVTGKYTYHEVAWITDWTDVELYSLFNASGGLMVIKELNRFCLYGTTSIDYWSGRFSTYCLDSGTEIKEYKEDLMPNFPYRGIGHCTYYNNHVYGMIEYSTRNGQEIYRGLCDINLETELTSYHRPSYASTDQYDLLDGVIMSDGRLAFAAWGYGVVVYDTNAETWILYNNDNVSGFEPVGTYNCISVAYNSLEDIIYVGSSYPPVENGWCGVRAIPEAGSFNQGHYMLGTLSADWEFTEPLSLSQGLSDLNFAIAIDDTGILWSSWIRKDLSLYSIKWDKDQADLDLTPFLIGQTSVSWDVENKSSLNFKLSYGHLFDANNSLSAINIYSKKGRPVALRFGEKIDGIDYWQSQGTYYIKTTKVSYGQFSYPSITITCEDRLSMFDGVKIIVSDYYNDHYPEPVIRSLITTYTGLEESDILIDDFDTRHTIWHQIVEKDLEDSMTDILDHFEYFSRMDVNNKVSTRRLKTFVDAVDHVYTLSVIQTITDFTPDDNYSSLTNRVIVKSELLDPLEVLYPEELVTSLSGSGGWWEKGHVHETVYFSDDKEKKCRDPRLEVITSIKDFKILWQESGGTESMSFVSPDELYVIITIEFPGLQSMLVVLLAAVIVVGAAASSCDYWNDCGEYMMAFTILVSAVGYLLGQVATYEYEIYARPLGDVKQTIQGEANDEEFQSFLGLVSTAEIEDEFCYDVAECQRIAEYELSLVQAQRKRISFTKLAHLQDEVGDIIQIYHPYSKLPLNIFITSLKRYYVSGKSGQFIDTIEGWNI
jgi:hypothetical protein